MKKVDFPVWDNEVDIIIKEIYRVTSQFKSVMEKLKTQDISYDDFKIFYDNVCKTLDQWTGHTYVGYEKEKPLRKAFQAFFLKLLEFLNECWTLDNPFLNKLANEALYQGVAYRYLGHGSPYEDLNKTIEPRFDDIFVSWSKKPDDLYIQSKLYGRKTLMTCSITEPYYGIDLEPFGVVRGDEAEVVFPTIKETIIGIKYLS